MTIKINQSDVNAYLEEVLGTLNDGKITALQARNDLAQTLTMAAIDKQDDLSSYMTVKKFRERWKLT